MRNKNLQIAVAGGGSWGTALAHAFAQKGYNVDLVLRNTELANNINTTHENTRYLAGYKLSKNITAKTELHALADKDIIILAIPTQRLREYLKSIEKIIKPDAILVNTAKGFEVSSKKIMRQVVHDVLGHKNHHYATLSGPSFAAEVIQNFPTTVSLGCESNDLGMELCKAFSSDHFRCYLSCDVVGIEIGGAVKNVIAIAAGICDGLGFGHNSRAAIITRGLAEMSRLGVALGGQAATFMGLSGIGDLMLTCAGDLSRNRQVGLRLGKGESLEYILNSLGMVAEGVATTKAVYEMTNELLVRAPIVQVVYDVLYKNADPKQIAMKLMTRSIKNEEA